MQLTKNEIQAVRNSLNRKKFNLHYTSVDIRHAAEQFKIFDSSDIADTVIKNLTSQIQTVPTPTQQQEPQQPQSMNNSSLTTTDSNSLNSQIQSVANEYNLAIQPVEITVIADLVQQRKGVNFQDTVEFSSIEIFQSLSIFLSDKKGVSRRYLQRQAAILREELSKQTKEIHQEVIYTIKDIVEEDDKRMRDWATSIGDIFRKHPPNQNTESERNN